MINTPKAAELGVAIERYGAARECLGRRIGEAEHESSDVANCRIKSAEVAASQALSKLLIMLAKTLECRPETAASAVPLHGDSMRERMERLIVSSGAVAERGPEAPASTL